MTTCEKFVMKWIMHLPAGNLRQRQHLVSLDSILLPNHETLLHSFPPSPHNQPQNISDKWDVSTAGILFLPTTCYKHPNSTVEAGISSVCYHLCNKLLIVILCTDQGGGMRGELCMWGWQGVDFTPCFFRRRHLCPDSDLVLSCTFQPFTELLSVLPQQSYIFLSQSHYCHFLPSLKAWALLFHPSSLHFSCPLYFGLGVLGVCVYSSFHRFDTPPFYLPPTHLYILVF